MAVWTIIRVYKVPADDYYQATDRMMEAVAFHVESHFHEKDYIRAPGDKPGTGKAKPVDLKPPTGWLTLLKRQLSGQ